MIIVVFLGYLYLFLLIILSCLLDLLRNKPDIAMLQRFLGIHRKTVGRCLFRIITQQVYCIKYFANCLYINANLSINNGLLIQLTVSINYQYSYYWKNHTF